MQRSRQSTPGMLQFFFFFFFFFYLKNIADWNKSMKAQASKFASDLFSLFASLASSILLIFKFKALHDPFFFFLASQCCPQ